MIAILRSGSGADMGTATFVGVERAAGSLRRNMAAPLPELADSGKRRLRGFTQLRGNR